MLKKIIILFIGGKVLHGSSLFQKCPVAEPSSWARIDHVMTALRTLEEGADVVINYQLRGPESRRQPQSLLKSLNLCTRNATSPFFEQTFKQCQRKSVLPSTTGHTFWSRLEMIFYPDTTY